MPLYPGIIIFVKCILLPSCDEVHALYVYRLLYMGLSMKCCEMGNMEVLLLDCGVFAIWVPFPTRALCKTSRCCPLQIT